MAYKPNKQGYESTLLAAERQTGSPGQASFLEPVLVGQNNLTWQPNVPIYFHIISILVLFQLGLALPMAMHVLRFHMISASTVRMQHLGSSPMKQ